MLNDKIKKLIELQEIDRELDLHQSQLDRLPGELESYQIQTEELKNCLESEKKKLTDAQLRKKEKEVELAASEEKMRKGEMELNTIKSNETYKLKLKEIDQFKEAISKVEDDILVLMDEIDHTSIGLKKMEQENKKKEEQIRSEKADKEAQIKKVQALFDSVLKKRELFCNEIEPDLFVSYETIRKKRKGAVLTIIIGESCGGCHTILTPHTINEVRKAKDLIVCDSCSMILYIEEVPTAT